ncbi:MAG: acyl--CoA ligase [Acidobacteriota bacterium]|nr:MAG: acyl--CoA ligase [Acidobacteriota bacterium]
MIGKHLSQALDGPRDRIALVYGEKKFSFGELAERAEALRNRWRELAGRRVGVAIHRPDAFIPAVTALDGLGAHAFLVGQRNDTEIDELKGDFGWYRVLREADVDATPLGEASGAPPIGETVGMVTLLTSGTTGKPKAANHYWSSLGAPVRYDDRFRDKRWLCAYSFHLYAGTQVFLQALISWAALVVPPELEPRRIARLLHEAGVTHASGTPTLFRQILLFGAKDDLARCSLEQITLGGEAVPQPLLDELTRVLPQTRLVHIYGSSEMGRLFVVTDRQEGFPARFLEDSPEPNVELKIVDGELWARSRVNAMIGYDGQKNVSDVDEGWFATGDLVERVGERVLWRGRRSDMINVGGRKVMPGPVERVLRAVPGVADVRVYAKRSSIVGQLVAADIVLAKGAVEADVRAAIARAAETELVEHARPRIVNIVGELRRSEAFKVLRREES